MPFLRYKPKNMGDVQLYLHGINGDVAVEFAEGATLPGGLPAFVEGILGADRPQAEGIRRRRGA